MDEEGKEICTYMMRRQRVKMRQRAGDMLPSFLLTFE